MMPKYKQIEERFIREINSGKLAVGAQLPAETAITEETGFSRMTVNKALKQLEQQGYITRVSGRGSFVKAKAMTRNVTDTVGFSEYMRSRGMTPGSQLLTYALVDLAADPARRDELELAELDKVHRIERLRTGDGAPIAITEDYLAANLITTFNPELLSRSLYAYLDRLKIPIIQNFVEIKACKATARQQSLLKLEDDFVLETVANVDTITIAGQRQRLGRFASYYNPKRFTYRFVANN
ncbi:GntR family transcriptional regulator [Lacticaseibacillus absianus]|uniref:GntR family transcriptional regulator n=1 Tax=Lacticaseibacillus absianus TaxID=2729623 RepID=UPI0015C9C0DD|nr:GntR family transcriptional regulator [Lacticaseibacillus absianus]